MARFIAVYLHGFLSSGSSKKGLWFKQQIEQPQQQPLTGNSIVSCITPTYQISSPHLSATQIDATIQVALKLAEPESAKVLLMGSSMGGFYSRFFADKYQLPYIMINPALNACELLAKHLGEYHNPNTDEKVIINQRYIDDLANYEIKEPNQQLPSLLLIDKDDEVIDVDFAFQCYQKHLFTRHQTIVYSGGDHSFIHLDDAWCAIQHFVDGL